MVNEPGGGILQLLLRLADLAASRLRFAVTATISIVRSF